MKKLIFVLFLILAFAGNAFAVGSVTQALGSMNYDTRVKVWIMSFTGDSSDGTVPATATTINIDGYVTMVVTDPGGTAPTDNYDITLTDANGVDIMGGSLANRDTINTEQAFPLLDATNFVYGPRYVSGTLTLTITNQSVNSATGQVLIYIQR